MTEPTFTNHLGRPCLVKDCLCLSAWTPTVEVWSADNDKKFRLDFNIPVCDKHKATLTLKDIIPDATLSVIQDLFRFKFIHPPTRETMKLEWTVETPKVLSFYGTNGKKFGDVGVVNNGGLIK